MAKTEKQQQTANRYLKEKVEPFVIRVPKGKKQKYRLLQKHKNKA